MAYAVTANAGSRQKRRRLLSAARPRIRPKIGMLISSKNQIRLRFLHLGECLSSGIAFTTAYCLASRISRSSSRFARLSSATRILFMSSHACRFAFRYSSSYCCNQLLSRHGPFFILLKEGEFQRLRKYVSVGCWRQAARSPGTVANCSQDQ
jgi:hypothetical protein